MAILNMIGGGGGGLDWDSAIIHIYAPAGSTVTAQKSGGTAVTLQEHTVSGADSEYIHIVKYADYGTYTITATKSGQTASGTVNVTNNVEYQLQLFYLVPSEYQAVEFLQTTGTQFISTNINAEKGTSIEATVSVVEYEDGGFIVGGSGQYHFNFFDFTASYTRLFYMGNAAENITYGNSCSLNSMVNLSGTLREGLQQIIVNGVETKKTLTSSRNPSGVLLIFKSYNNTKIPKVKLFSLKITVNDILKGDFVPCYRKSDNVAGLWDRVSETFFTNAGTGTFIVGEPI